MLIFTTICTGLAAGDQSVTRTPPKRAQSDGRGADSDRHVGALRDGATPSEAAVRYRALASAPGLSELDRARAAYNLGTTLLAAGDAPSAVVELRRAETLCWPGHIGLAADIRRNLALARQRLVQPDLSASATALPLPPPLPSSGLTGPPMLNVSSQRPLIVEAARWATPQISSAVGAAFAAAFAVGSLIAFSPARRVRIARVCVACLIAGGGALIWSRVGANALDQRIEAVIIGEGAKLAQQPGAVIGAGDNDASPLRAGSAQASGPRDTSILQRGSEVLVLWVVPSPSSSADPGWARVRRLDGPSAEGGAAMTGWVSLNDLEIVSGRLDSLHSSQSSVGSDAAPVSPSGNGESSAPAVARPNQL